MQQQDPLAPPAGLLADVADSFLRIAAGAQRWSRRW